MSTQAMFWHLVATRQISGVKVNICRDALADTPNIDIGDFIAEALDHDWIDSVSDSVIEAYGPFI